MSAPYHVRAEANLTTPPLVTVPRPVKYVIIHHTAGVRGLPYPWDPARWKAIERGEQANGYTSLAYNFGVNNGLPGQAAIQEARGWGIRNAATGGTAPNGYAWNAASVAIVVDGYFHPPHSEKIGEPALDACADVIVAGVYLGFIARDFEVIAHRDASAGTKWATACPGDEFYPFVNGWAGSIALRARQKLAQVPSAAPQPPPPSAPAPTPPRCVQIASRRTLRRGDSGPSVKVLQNALIGRGYNVGAVDGVYGKRTEDNVKCFQRASGLSADGIVGPQTWAALGQ